MSQQTSRHAEPIQVLHPEESWEFLRGHEFGRLAYHLVGEVHLVPINYAVNDERIIFLTHEGSKLLGITMNSDVAFEVDQVGDDQATSVIVRGRARQLEGSARYVIEELPLRPWVAEPKHAVVAITVAEITGRRFDLTQPWLNARADSAEG